MSGMSLAKLREDLKLILQDAANKFEEPNLELHLARAAEDLPRVRPLIVADSMTLVADQSLYSAPADLLRPLIFDWGVAERKSRKPWNDDWPGQLPKLGTVNSAGVEMLMLSPAPTAAQISQLGSSAPYRYSAVYVIGEKDADTTVKAADRDLLLVRAAADAMQSLALNGVAKPVTLGGKAGISLPKNGTPQALADALMKQFERMAA